MSKITSHPPKKSAQDFILAAEKKAENSSNILPKEKLPWELDNVRSDVHKVFTVKLPEEYLIKIKYLSDKTNKSQQKIVREVIQKEIDQLLQEQHK
jgi:hypothetical protein